MKKDTDKYWRIGIYAFLIIGLFIAGIESPYLIMMEGIAIVLYMPWLYADWIRPYLRERKERQAEQFERDKLAAMEKFVQQQKEAESKRIDEAVNSAVQSAAAANQSDPKKQVYQRMVSSLKAEAEAKAQAETKVQSGTKELADTKTRTEERAQAKGTARAETENRPAVFDPEKYVRFLGDLRLSAFPKGSGVFLAPEEEIGNLSDRFFADSGILSYDGQPVSEEEKLRAMRQILAFGSQWRRGSTESRDTRKIRSVSGKLSQIIREDEEESFCLDGGNYLPDGVDTYVTCLSFCYDPKAVWSDLEDRRKSRLKEAEDQFRRSGGKISYMNEDRRDWGYDGALQDENIEVCTFGRNKLYLKDPFGLSGVFYYEDLVTIKQ